VSRALRRRRLTLTVFFASLLLAPDTPSPARAATGTPCSTSGTWVQGELNIYWFDVEQGDAQLVIGPGGTTMLIDLGENAWNTTTGTNAERVAAEIRAICGVSGSVHLDYVMASHHHLDHVGYAGNPHDGSTRGNGVYQLLHPDHLDFSVGRLIDRDGGVWKDANGDGDCEVGSNAGPSPDIEWHNAGTQSSTARRWICWLYGPRGQRDRANIEGKVLRLTNDQPWPSFDLGAGAEAVVLQANAKGVMQADGVTPVSGNHVDDSVPPSENDYSIAVRFTFGDYQYATAGDTDGEYATSGHGYSYNDVEASVKDLFGDVETMRVNHHGSSHSTSNAYTGALAPETAVISCGNNSYGHPANRVLDELREVANDNGTGADIYVTNKPCDTDAAIDYSGLLNTDGTVHAHTTGGGAGYEFHYDAGSRSYTAGSTTASGVTISEARFRGPGGASDELIELRNVGSSPVDTSGWVLEGCADSSGDPSKRATVASGTTLAAGQHYLFANNGYTGSVPPDTTYSTGISDGGGARIVDATGAVVDGVASSAGSTDQCREGTGLSFPPADDDVSFHRKGSGATDTDDNSADFEGPSTSSPKNASSSSSDGGSGDDSGATVADVVINEYVPDNAGFATEWVELYNPTSTDLDLSGLWIDDTADGGGSPKKIASGTVIAAGGHEVVTWSGYLLNNGGDDVRLLSADQATVYDSHSYASSADDRSYRRAGDGGAWCANDGTATQGSANPTTCP
jgi:beta-lactamase superfamily II metal-dependent hydrolase